MGSSIDEVLGQIDAHVAVATTVKDMAASIAQAADIVTDAFRAGSQLLVCGNGGSAADAQHIAAEFSGRFLIDRDPLPAIALTTNTSALTAIGNDYGFDEVFARQVRAHGRPGDVIIAISTSGNSANVVKACEAARAFGMSVIGLLGFGGGKIGPLCDIVLAPETDSTPRIQEAHILIAHILCGLVEEAVCGKQ